ncbi:MAG: PLP-dependent aminotransferase family protein [Pseudomonadales bacterium]
MSEIIYDFGSGRSDPGTFPKEALQKAAVAAIEKEAVALTNYPGNLGHPGLRAAMARRESEREGVHVDPEHIVITNGSMQAVTLTAEALQESHGDPIILEEFSYPGTLSAYRSLKFEIHGIPLSEQGMRLDVLEARLEELDKAGRRPKFIYTITTYQNPTGFVMPKANRLQLIELARRYDVPVIEDNCYGDVHYDGPVEPALYALDDDPNHIYLGSLSKILAPGLRLGYLLARPPMLERILARRHDAGSNTLAAAIAAEFYRDGIWDHASYANDVLRVKRDLLLDKLAEELDDICAWSKPVGGLFVWVRIPDDVDRKKLYQLAQNRGFNYLPGVAFHVETKNVPYLRLAFGHLTLEQIAEGLPVLARCIRETRTSNESRDFDSLF